MLDGQYKIDELLTDLNKYVIIIIILRALFKKGCIIFIINLLIPNENIAIVFKRIRDYI